MKIIKPIIFICFLAMGICANAQTKEKILLELEAKLMHQLNIPDYYEVKLYYNIEEKILDIDENGDNLDGIIIPLNEASFKYIPTKTNHYLDIKCKNYVACMYSKSSNKQIHIGRPFQSKNTVYEIIDLIHKLKKIE